MKDIKNYEDKYCINQSGQVFSKNFRRTGKLHELSQSKQSNTYLMQTLSAFGLSRTFHVHKLVAETFLPNPNGYKHIIHLDGNTHNNNVSNLQWVEEQDYLEHCYATGLKTRPKAAKDVCFGRKLTKDDVVDIRSLSAKGVANIQLASEYGVSKDTIYKILKGITWKCV